MKVRVQTGLALLAAGILSTACTEPAPAAKASPAAPAGTTAAAVPAGGATGASEFGVPECDRYVKNYLACVETNVPEAARAGVRASFDQARAAWKQAAATPEGRQGLAMACQQSEAATKQAMVAYGCKW
jgi:hypothetical protein